MAKPANTTPQVKVSTGDTPEGLETELAATPGALDDKSASAISKKAKSKLAKSKKADAEHLRQAVAALKGGLPTSSS